MNYYRLSAIAFVLGGFMGCGSGSNDVGNGTQPDSAAQQWVNQNFSQVNDDQSPSHNQAWRDSSGTVWSPTIVNSKAQPGTIDAAEQGCNLLGATLPSASQLDRLAKFLGRDSSYGFHPTYQAKNWDFSGSTFWSEATSDNPAPGDTVKAMNGDTGQMIDYGLLDPTTGQPTLASALCVFPKERPSLTCVLYSPKCAPFFTGVGPIQFVQVAGKAQAGVVLSASDDNEVSTMTLVLGSADGTRTTSRSYQFEDGSTTSGEVDFSTGGVKYRLLCSGARNLHAGLVPGPSCQ